MVEKIDKNKLKKLEPEKNVEYIYIGRNLYDGKNLGPEKTIEEDVIVVDVVLEDNMFHYTLKESGERYQTFYGWALRENTPENLIKIQEHNELNDLAKHIIMIAEKKRREIICLEM